MTLYDWIICGGGVTGAALGYELQRSGFRVAIIDRCPTPPNATRFSYGGIPYWSGTTELTQTLCQESIGRYPSLGDELDYDIGFREIKLLLTAGDDRESVRQNYTFAQEIDLKTVAELEPLLNLDTIAAVFVLDHAQVDPESLVSAYLQAFTRSGGTLIYAEIVELLEQGVRTQKRSIGSGGVIVCAGGMGRRLGQRSGISLPLYFSHAELIETAPNETRLQTFVMPATLKRIPLEAKGISGTWAEDQPQILPPVFDVGGAPLRDGRMRLGQISRLHPNPDFVPEPTTEQQIRSGIQHLFPQIADLTGSWHHCLVAFSPDGLPLISQINNYWWIFSGFTSPMVFVPPLALRFANYLRSRQDQVINYLIRRENK